MDHLGKPNKSEKTATELETAELESVNPGLKSGRVGDVSQKRSNESVVGIKSNQDLNNPVLPEISIVTGGNGGSLAEKGERSTVAMTGRAVEAANPADRSLRQPWHIINSMFQAAEKASDNDLAPYGGFKKATVLAEQLKLHLGVKYDAWRVNSQLQPEKNSSTSGMLDSRQGLMNLTYDQVVATLIGQNGADMQKNLSAVFSQEDIRMAQNISMLENMSRTAIEVRKQYALAASKYGFEDKNDSIKQFAVDKLESISSMAPYEFSFNPELKGMQAQAKRSERMQLDNNEAEALAYVDSGIRSIESLTMTLLPGIIPPGSLTTEQKENLATKLEVASELDKDRTDSELRKFVEKKEDGFKTSFGDAFGVGATFVTKSVLSRTLSSLPLPGYARAVVGLAGALAAGGFTNSVVSEHSIASGMFRNAGVSLLAYGGFKSFQYNPSAVSSFGLVGKMVGRDLAAGYAIGASYKGLDYAAGLKSWDENALSSINHSGLGFALTAAVAVPVYSMPFALSRGFIAPKALEAMGQAPRYIYDGAKIGWAPLAAGSVSNFQAQSMKEVLGYRSEHKVKLSDDAKRIMDDFLIFKK